MGVQKRSETSASEPHCDNAYASGADVFILGWSRTVRTLVQYEPQGHLLCGWLDRALWCYRGKMDMRR